MRKIITFISIVAALGLYSEIASARGCHGGTTDSGSSNSYAHYMIGAGAGTKYLYKSEQTSSSTFRTLCGANYNGSRCVKVVVSKSNYSTSVGSHTCYVREGAVSSRNGLRRRSGF